MNNHIDTALLSSIEPAIARSMLEALAEHATDSIMITSTGSNKDFHPIVFVNHAFTEMTGYAAVEVLGKTPVILHGPRTESAVLDDLRRKLNNGKPFHGQTINYRKDGSEFPIEWKVIPVRDVSGEPTHHLAIQRDVSRPKLG